MRLHVPRLRGPPEGPARVQGARVRLPSALRWFCLALSLSHFLPHTAVHGYSTPKTTQPQLDVKDSQQPVSEIKDALEPGRRIEIDSVQPHPQSKLGQAQQTGRIQAVGVRPQAAAGQSSTENGTLPFGASAEEPLPRRDLQEGNAPKRRRRRRLGAMLPRNLFGEWTAQYGVERSARRRLDGSQFTEDGLGPHLLPPGTAPPPSTCPHFMAPHLLCCDALTKRRQRLEQLGPNGELPAWTQPQAGESPKQQPYPRPPWVPGTPEDNLPMTHQAQADIWRHQFPADGCSSPDTKFVVTFWDAPQAHGIGSHMGLMSLLLGAAMKHGRVLTMLNWTYTRAMHMGCPKEDMGSFTCYFFSPASKACSDVATQAFLDATQRGEMKIIRRNDPLDWRTRDMMLSSDQRMVVLGPRAYRRDNVPIPTIWGEPWLGMNNSQALGTDRVHWWIAQGTRFLLRWPSAYLCHILNFARHQAYGLEVAEAVLVKRKVYRPRVDEGTDTKVAEFVAAIELPDSHCSKDRHLCSFSEDDADMGGLGIDPLPFIPRPLVRVHVRGSDKFVEKRLLGAGTYFQSMEKLRRTSGVPFKNVWLSSEEEAPFSEAERWSNWTVYKLLLEQKHSARDGTQHLNQWEFVRKFGIRDYVEASFANLFVSSLSDGFVLWLPSNWERLANALRITGGKLKAPVAALD